MNNPLWVLFEDEEESFVFPDKDQALFCYTQRVEVLIKEGFEITKIQNLERDCDSMLIWIEQGVYVCDRKCRDQGFYVGIGQFVLTTKKEWESNLT